MFPTRGIRLILVACALFLPVRAHAAAFLFDATKAESAGNANWVVDEDGGVAGRYPTPAAVGITSSTPETYWTGALSSWGVALVQLGHSVEQLPVGARLTYGDGTNPQDLANYQVYVVCEPNILFTAAERSALARFVQDGGSLFVVSDHVGSDRNNDGYDSVAIWNDFFANNGVQANPFGVKINQTNISVVSTEADNDPGDPLISGLLGAVTTLKYSNGATVTLDTGANPTVHAAFWSTSTHANSNVMAAYGSFGAGRFVVMCDSSPIDDGTGTAGHTLYYGWTEEGVNHSRLVLNASLWLASARNGGVPFNDSFASAGRLDASSSTVTGSNAGAGEEPGEPAHAGNAGGASVWWQFTPANSGVVALSTQGSDFDTLLAVYTGDAVNALAPVAANDNANAGVTSSAVSFAVTAGTTYRVAVDGANGATGRVSLALTLPAPSNDAFADATAISYSGTALTLTGNSFNATAETGEPEHAGYTGGRSTWWRLVVPAGGYVTVSTVGSDFDTLLGVYTGANVGGLTTVASNANYGSLLQSLVSFNAQAGVAYFIAVDGYAGAAGHITLSVYPGNPNSPVNDNFVNATTLSGASPKVNATNTYATAEPGEPYHSQSLPNHSVWWRWTAASDGFVQVNTTNSAVPVALSVYTGGSLNTLTSLAEAGSASSPSVSTTVRVLADTTYYFAVDSSQGTTGKVYLNLTFTATPAVPPNDNFANAIALSGTSGSGNGSNANATVEVGEPTAAAGRTVWWRWTAPADLIVTGNNNGSFLPYANFYSGSTLVDLKLVFTASLSTGFSFGARAGTTYWWRFDGDSSGQPGLIAFNYTTQAMPTVSVAATTPVAREAGQVAGVFTLTLDHAISYPVNVIFSLGGTATRGPDYTASSTTSVTVAANQTTATVTIRPVDDGDPTEGDESVVLTVADGSLYKASTTAAAATVTIRDNSPYSPAWAGTYRPRGFTGAQAAPAADPDGDGLSNLLEWAFDRDPLTPDAPGASPTAGTGSFADPAEPGGTLRRFPTLTFVRRTDAPNLTYTVEFTDDPGSEQWSGGNVVFVSSDTAGMRPNMERVTYRSPSPLDGPNAAARGFLRVRVDATILP